MNHTTPIVIVILVFILFLLVVLITTAVLSQQVLPNANAQQIPSTSTQPSSIPPKLHAVKIISPTKGQQVPVEKDLIISGTSLDNATSHCQVSVKVNNVKPYQSATATGTGGTKDYSKWTFMLTFNYTTIKEGPNNRILAKYSCIDPPSPTSFSSVNVTGVSVAANTSIPQQEQRQQNVTTTSSPQQEQRQQNVTTTSPQQEQRQQNVTTTSPQQKTVICDPKDIILFLRCYYKTFAHK
jgi:hypothetical protein